MAWAVYLVPRGEFDPAEWPPDLLDVKEFDPDTVLVVEPVSPFETLNPAINSHQVALVRNLASLDRLLRTTT